MQHYTTSLFDTFGNAISGATITVYAAGTTTPSTLYSDNVGTSLANPLTSGLDGSFDFYALTGRYDLVITHPGHTFVAADTAGIVLLDPIEGNWTIGVSFNSPGNLAVVYSTQIGRYVKTGRVVQVTGNLTTTTFTHTTAVGNFHVTGLPFPAENTVGLVTAGSVAMSGWTKANYTQLSVFLTAGTSACDIVATGSGQAADVLDTGDVPSGGTIQLYVSFRYRADS